MYRFCVKWHHFFFLLIKLVFEMKLICPTQTGLDLTHDLTFHVIFCFLISSVSGMRCPYSARRQFTDSFYMASSVYDSFSTRRVTSTSGPSVPNPFLLSGGPPIPLLSIPPLPHPLLWSYSWPHALLLHPPSPSRSRQLRFLFFNWPSVTHPIQNRARVMCPVCSILQTGHITLSFTPDQQLENHRYVHLYFKCLHLSITTAFIQSHLTNGIPDPQTETTKLYPAKNLPRTPTHGPHDTQHTL